MWLRAVVPFVATVVHVVPFVDRCTTYAVIGDPPLLVGADQLTFTCPEPTPDAGATTAVTDCGAPGIVRGVADAVADAAPVPAALTADTRNV